MGAIGEAQDLTFEAFASHDFYRVVNEHLVDMSIQVRSKIALPPIHRVLDLACGTGAVTALLVDRVKKLRDPVQVIAVDPSESALEKARRLVGNAAEFVRGQAQAFSHVVSNVDLITFCNAIHLLPNKDIVLDEARTVLNADGVLAFNSSFYEGCYVPGTEKFYRLWMLKAMRTLKQEYGVKTDHTKVEAMRWLTPDDYRELLEKHGFVIDRMETEQAMMTCKSWQDISHYSEFAEGALPGVPLDLAIPVLQRSVQQAYDELGVTELPRNWLQVVARAV